MKATKSIIVGMFVLLTAQIASAYYCPSTGRWLSRDPIGEPGFETLRSTSVSTSIGSIVSLSPTRWIQRDSISTKTDFGRYAFVRNNPNSKVDFLGLATAQISIYTEIRPPDPEDGVKTIHAVTVDDKGSILRVLTFVGATVTPIGAPTGAASFGQAATPGVSVEMDVIAHSALLPPAMSIRYGFLVDLDFCRRDGHLFGNHETYPSYKVMVNGKVVYDFPQKTISGLIGYPIIIPHVHFKF